MASTIRRALIVAITATGFSLTAASTVRAQDFASANAPRWRAWLGCWAAVVDTARSRPPGARAVCVAPTDDGNIVDVSAFSDGQVLSRDRIDASGRPHVVDVNNCAGTETAHWSADQRRVYLRSSVICDGVPRQMTAVLAMNQLGEWLDVRSTTAGGESNVRVARYRDVGIPDGVPGDITRPLIDHRMSTLSARIATGAPVGSGAIIEAAHILDAATLEAFTRESGQRFATDARTLTELADAGVPARVTDAMIEVSNRTVFSGNRDDDSYRRVPRSCGIYGCYGCYGGSTSDAWDQGTGQRIYVTVYPAYDPWGFGYWPFGRYYARGLLGYAPYGYAPYGLAPYGYGGWGYGYGDNYRGRSVTGYYRPPVIVLHANQGGTESRGRSERGSGYTQGERAVPRRPDTPVEPPRTAAPRPVPQPPTPEQVPTKANERNGGTENPASSSGRTARPRP